MTAYARVNRLAPTAQHDVVIFGYGSLADPASRAQQVTGTNWDFGHLNHFRRKFNATGLENTPRNYKHFVTNETREDIISCVPAFHPTYLNAAPTPNHRMYGVYFAATANEFRKIKEREANYNMVDVTAFVPQDINLNGKPCYMAIAHNSAQCRSMYETARIAKPYWDMCVAAHRSTPELRSSWLADAAFPDFTPMPVIDVSLPSYLEKY